MVYRIFQNIKLMMFNKSFYWSSERNIASLSSSPDETIIGLQGG